MVSRALQHERFRKILIIGTSERMVQKICDRLQLPHPIKVIKIEEIATKAEIEKAVQSRKVEGKHVIPVPALEIKRNYPSIFYDSVRVFLKRSFGVGATFPKLYEKSVVRPEYGKRGRVAISEAALSQMVVHCVNEFDPNVRIMRLAIRNDTQGYRITVMLEVPYGTRLASKLYALQEYIVDSIEKFTGILVAEVNIVIDRLAVHPQRGKNGAGLLTPAGSPCSIADICGCACGDTAVIVSKENKGALWKKAKAQENSDAQTKKKRRLNRHKTRK